MPTSYLMQMHSSYVVTDPKGTVLVECGKMLEKGGYIIKSLNTINFRKSMHYNPFSYIRSEKDILKLVNTIIVNTKGDGDKSGEDFWVKAEKLYYTALIGYIWYEAPDHEKNFTTLLEMINASEAREDDETFKNPVDVMFDELEARDPDHFAVKQYRKYKLAAGGTIAGKVRIVFLESLGPTQDNLRAAANSVVKEQGVFDGHIKVEKGTSGTCVDYNSVNFIDEVAKTRTLKLVLQPNAVEKPETPATVNGREFMYWTKEGASEAWDFNTEIKGPLTLYAVRTPASSGGYYYYPTTDTKADDAKDSPKTADPGVALYAALSLLSLTGLTCTAKKRH